MAEPTKEEFDLQSEADDLVETVIGEYKSPEPIAEMRADNVVKEESAKGDKPKRRLTANKIKLIDDICLLNDKLKLVYDRTVLEQMKVADLKKMLAELVEKSAKVIQETNTELTERESGAKGLYRLHSIVMLGLEELSCLYEDKLGSSLKGLSTLTDENRKELEDILGRIYMEHRDSIKPFISPLHQYALLTFRMASVAFIRNKKTSPDKSLKPSAGPSLDQSGA
jgi:hypothetical protein